MQDTRTTIIAPREQWLLNFYRNSELNGALLMGRLARSVWDAALLAQLTAHCASEARHAALFTALLDSLDIPIDPRGETIQNLYAAKGGIPREMEELLVLSETLERRVRISYHAHLGRRHLHPAVEALLREILSEMEEKHDGDHELWIKRRLASLPADKVEEARRKWQPIDEEVARELQERVHRQFPEPEL